MKHYRLSMFEIVALVRACINFSIARQVYGKKTTDDNVESLLEAILDGTEE